MPPHDLHPARRRGLSVAWRMLRRLPFVLAALLLDLVPVACSPRSATLMLTTPLGAQTNTRLVVLAVVDAYVLCRVVMCVTRTFVSPANHRLRLIQCDDYWAAFIVRWVRRLSAVAVFGFAAAEVGLLFGLYRSAHDVFIKLVALAVHVMLVRGGAAVAPGGGTPAARPARADGRAGQPAEPLRGQLALRRHLLHRGALAGGRRRDPRRLRAAAAPSSW